MKKLFLTLTIILCATMALSGINFYSLNPYYCGNESGRESGDCWVGRFKCDYCGNLQDLWHE